MTRRINPFRDDAFLAELKSRRLEDRYLIDGLIHRAMTVIAGAPGAGKTFLACGAVAALLNGESEYLGQKVSRRPVRSVLWIHTDMDAEWEVLERLDLMLGDRARCDTDLTLVPYLGGMDLCEEVERVGADLLVIDNLLGVAFAEGRDILVKQRDCDFIMSNIEAVAEKVNVPTLVLHHSAKPGQEGQAHPGVNAIMGPRRISQRARSKGSVTKNRATGIHTVTMDNNQGEDLVLTFRFNTAGLPEIAAPKVMPIKRAVETVDRRQEVAARVIREQPEAASIRSLARWVHQEYAESWTEEGARKWLPGWVAHQEGQWVRLPEAA